MVNGLIVTFVSSFCVVLACYVLFPVDKGHQQGGQLFEGRGWAENLHTDLTYTGWKNKLAERAAVKATLDAKVGQISVPPCIAIS